MIRVYLMWSGWSLKGWAPVIKRWYITLPMFKVHHFIWVTLV